MVNDLSGDLRTAVRSVTRAPGTSALIVFTLGSAIAAATIGFTFADLALLRGIPVDDASRVVTVFASDTQGSNPRARVSGPEFLDIRDRSTTLIQLAAFRDGLAPLIRDGQSRTLRVSYATATLFTVMGQGAIRGRAFADGDDRPGAAPVALLSHRYWQQEQSRREDAVGQTMQIGREHFIVIGVMSPELEFGNIAEIDVWLPLRLDPAGPRDARNLRFLARLRDAADFDRAAAEMATIGRALAADHPATSSGWSLRLAPVAELTGAEGVWIVIALFLLSVVLLLAIATANVSNLVLARVQSRIAELAVRAALGAPRPVGSPIPHRRPALVGHERIAVVSAGARRVADHRGGVVRARVSATDDRFP
jgi:putative ABC transport system permease protein